FLPVRDDRFDYRGSVDGSDPATDWQGLTPLDRLPTVHDPRTGWLYNANDSPWRAAGPDSPREADFPRYTDNAGANPRGDHAIALLTGAHDLTPEALRRIAYDPQMPFFDVEVPALVRAWNALPQSDPLRARLQDPVALLRDWDRRWSAESRPTTLAVFWATEMWALAERRRARHANMWATIHGLPDRDRIATLAAAVERLEREWGGWRVAWGEVNRFQRNDGAIRQDFDDRRPSVAVPFTWARWGSLASFSARPYPGTRRWYGTSGNSFVAIVEFGPRVRAWAVSAGGESGDPASRHFNDQAARYAAGDLRPVYFHPDELAGHIERTYRPGDRAPLPLRERE
ncbi:penicillin acylase family protein, partial [Sphingosinicella sp.]|uniref:penicillin acylase family protein n=1 Tax=Sphingosinicella sp. TaxID=1917971 RepID=UPI004037C022